MKEKINIGIIREGKVPPDFRVPLSPKQCREISNRYPNVQVFVQASPIRCFTDQEYINEGVTIQEDLSHCDYLFGVKEVNVNDLIPNKKYLFFSHTIKKQSYNRQLLRTILEKKIQLIDYELLKNRIGKRLIGFGRYAGIVGAYNGFRAFGIKSKTFKLKPAHQCADRVELEQELKKVHFPKNFKAILTGFGRVGYGSREIMHLLPIIEVSPEEFKQKTFDEAVFTHLDIEDYYARIDKSDFDKKDFYSEPSKYESIFDQFVMHADMYIACHFWSSASPYIYTLDKMQSHSRMKVIADISCDVLGPIASTLRPSSIKEPFYGFNPKTGKEDDYSNDGNIMVMAVDNLPCELPRDASIDFGNDLLQYIFPPLFVNDPDKIIERASETNLEGKLNEAYKFLEEYVFSL
ncbi:MAG: alanine dehydrogenase [Flavobacteriia bacterium]|nr:alanine dehydrogenase [Flavobacteriia bacterium]